MNSRKEIEFTVTAPGKIILFGEHSVVYGKTALAASVNLRTTLLFKTLDQANPYIIFELPGINLSTQFHIEDLNKFLVGPLPLMTNANKKLFSLDDPEIINFEMLLTNVKDFVLHHFRKVPLTLDQENAVVSFLCLLKGMLSSVNTDLPCCHIKITSEISIGAGMGSSTAFNICLATCLLHYIRRSLLDHKSEPVEVSREDYKSFVYWSTDLNKLENGELNLISRWGHLADRVMHGNPSGIDNAVCTHGSIIEFKKGEKGPNVKMIPDPKVLNVLLVHTKVPRDTKKLVSLVATWRERYTSILDPILSGMDSLALTAAEILRRVGQLNTSTLLLSDVTEKHISKEMSKLEELVTINQKLLEVLGVSHESLEHICRIASSEGLHAKLTGAGGGGFAYVLVPHGARQKHVNSVRGNLKRHQFLVQDVILGGPGVTLCDLFDPEPIGYKPGSLTSDSSKVTSLSHEPVTNEVYWSGSCERMDPDSSEHVNIPAVKAAQKHVSKNVDPHELVKSLLESHIERELRNIDAEAPRIPDQCTVFQNEHLPHWRDNIQNIEQRLASKWGNTINGTFGRLVEERRQQIVGPLRNHMTQMTGYPLYFTSIKNTSSNDLLQSMKTTQDKGVPVKNHLSSEKSECLSPSGAMTEVEQVKFPSWMRSYELFPSQSESASTWLKNQFPKYGVQTRKPASKLESQVKKQHQALRRKEGEILVQGGCGSYSPPGEEIVHSGHDSKQYHIEIESNMFNAAFNHQPRISTSNGMFGKRLALRTSRQDLKKGKYQRGVVCALAKVDEE